MTITATDAVTYELRGPVAGLTINRPEARNALSAAVREGLFAGTRRFNADADAKVLMLTGAGVRRSAPGVISRRRHRPRCACRHRTSCRSSAAPSAPVWRGR